MKHLIPTTEKERLNFLNCEKPHCSLCVLHVSAFESIFQYMETNLWKVFRFSFICSSIYVVRSDNEMHVTSVMHMVHVISPQLLHSMLASAILSQYMLPYLTYSFFDQTYVISLKVLQWSMISLSTRSKGNEMMKRLVCHRLSKNENVYSNKFRSIRHSQNTLRGLFVSSCFIYNHHHAEIIKNYTPQQIVLGVKNISDVSQVLTMSKMSSCIHNKWLLALMPSVLNESIFSPSHFHTVLCIALHAFA